MKRYFTLAEVLITLVIIGVVAALTFPALITKINTYVAQRQKDVIESKFINGLNLLNNLEYGLSHPYDSSKDFVKALSKYLKIVTICDAQNLNNCLNYDSIKSNDKNGNAVSIDVSEIKTAQDLHLGSEFEDIAGFVTADGVPFVVSYNKNCNADPDINYKEIISCVAGFYDINGSKKPNQMNTSIFTINKNTYYNNDLVSFNGARLNDCLAYVDDICITASRFSPQTRNCANFKSKSGLEISCNWFSSSYWVGAMEHCYDIGSNLPSVDELIKIAQVLYQNPNINLTQASRNEGFGGLNIKNKDLWNLLGFSVSQKVWSNQECGGSAAGRDALNVGFYENLVKYYAYNGPYKNDPGRFGICVSN